MERLRGALSQPTDLASLAAFRIMFGALMLGALLRTWSKGLIESAFIAPKFFFPHWGLGFLPAPGEHAYLVFACLGLLAGCIAIGFRTRTSAALFGVLFSYVHFQDATNYLNHYYLVALLSGLFACSPAGRLWSLDTRLTGGSGSGSEMPAWVLYLFRFQLGVVYFFAGFAKLNGDWLLLGEPLRTWLAANTDVPVIGSLFAHAWFAIAMSWLGAAYDLTIVLWLSLRRTRPFAYVAVVIFHLLTARLFEIGVFPFLMMAGSLLFLEPCWPRRFVRDAGPPAAASAPRAQVSRATLAVLALYVAVQLLVPLRFLLYPGNVMWTEQGYRFAWRVMLIEKTGSTELTLVDRTTGRRRTLFPRTLLSRNQTKAMATQPDMILAFAHHVAALERAQGRDVAVYAEAFAVLNGRAPARLIDPTVDLTRVEDGLADKPWITRGP